MADVLELAGGVQPDSIFLVSLGAGLLLLVSGIFMPSAAREPATNDDSTSESIRYLLRRPGLVRALMVSCLVLAAVDLTLVHLPVLGTERGIASGAVGLLLTIRAASSMVSRFFLGALSRQLGRGRLLTSSIVMAAVGVALVAVPMPMWLLVLVVVVMGFGLGAGQPLTMSWLAEATPAGMRGRAMSLRLTANRLGQVLVPSTAGLIAVGAGASGVLWAMAVALGFAGASSVHIPRSEPPDPDMS